MILRIVGSSAAAGASRWRDVRRRRARNGRFGRRARLRRRRLRRACWSARRLALGPALTRASTIDPRITPQPAEGGGGASAPQQSAASPSSTLKAPSPRTTNENCSHSREHCRGSRSPTGIAPQDNELTSSGRGDAPTQVGHPAGTMAEANLRDVDAEICETHRRREPPRARDRCGSSPARTTPRAP